MVSSSSFSHKIGPESYSEHERPRFCGKTKLSILKVQVCAYNRTTSKVDDFLAKEAAGMSWVNFSPEGTKVIGAHSIEELCQSLKKPRRVMMLVKAGSAVDDFIQQLVRLNDFVL